jgi:hypothetical protein
MIGAREEIVVAMDWSEFDRDSQSTLAPNMVSRHGRAAPLIWRPPLSAGPTDAATGTSRCSPATGVWKQCEGGSL